MRSLSTIANYNPIGEAIPRDKAVLTYLFKHKHMLEVVERYKWNELPPELTQDLIERVIFFRSKGALFKGVDDKYRFLPFTLSGDQGIDVYGRYIQIEPVLFTGTNKNENYFLEGEKLTVSYELGSEGDAVILHDSTLEVSQDNLPGSIMIEPLIEQMVEILVLINIDLISSAKTFFIVASDEAQKKAIELEFQNIDSKILNGKRVVVLLSHEPLQELTKTDSKDSNRYFQVYQSFENLRRDVIGVANSGTFMKMSIQTDSETRSSQQASAVLENGLRQRQEFCKLANSLFGLNISVEINETRESEVTSEESNNSLQNEGTVERDE